MIRRLWQKLTGPTTVDEWVLACEAIFIFILLRVWHRTGSEVTAAISLSIAVWLLARWLRDFRTWLLADVPLEEPDDDDGDDEEVEVLAPAVPPTKEEIRCH